jgi:hypothetical protein
VYSHLKQIVLFSNMRIKQKLFNRKANVSKLGEAALNFLKSLENYDFLTFFEQNTEGVKIIAKIGRMSVKRLLLRPLTAENWLCNIEKQTRPCADKLFTTF